MTTRDLSAQLQIDKEAVTHMMCSRVLQWSSVIFFFQFTSTRKKVDRMDNVALLMLVSVSQDAVHTPRLRRGWTSLVEPDWGWLF